MASDEETRVDMATVSKDTFTRWVKDVRAVDKEIKESAPALGALRKRKKQLDEYIQEWMQHNDVARVHCGGDEYLERQVKEVKQPVNADLIGTVLEQYFHDEAQAAEVTSLVYSSRTVSEKEFLKVVSENKKRKPRPVDGEEV